MRIMAYIIGHEELCDGNTFAYVEGMPGCDGIGHSLADALELCLLRLQLVINDALESGLPLPRPVGQIIMREDGP